MRIALITPYDVACFGGVSEHVAALQHELQSRGHEALVVAPRPGEAGSGIPAPFVGFGRTVSIRTNGSRARITLDPTCYPGLKALMHRERFDVVHVHELLTPLLPALALFASNAATIGTFHSFRDAPPVYSVPVRPLLANLLQRLDGRIAVSEPARQYIGRFGAGPCELIPNGVDLDRFGERAEPYPWTREGRPTILFVGRFDEPRKGFASLLRALPLVRDRFPETRLVVVGAGTQMRFRRLLGRLPTAAVAFAGTVGRGDLARYYASCDVFCAPSLGGESFGMVILEAMASGKPIVASDIPGYAALLTDGREGRLVEPGCPERLAAALVDLLADPTQRDRQSRQGRATAAAYAWPTVADRVLAAYDRCLRC